MSVFWTMPLGDSAKRAGKKTLADAPGRQSGLPSDPTPSTDTVARRLSSLSAARTPGAAGSLRSPIPAGQGSKAGEASSLDLMKLQASACGRDLPAILYVSTRQKLTWGRDSGPAGTGRPGSRTRCRARHGQ